MLAQKRDIAESLQRVTSMMMAGEAPSLDRYLRRLTTRAEHSVERFSATLKGAGTLWFWILLSTAAFLLVVGVASVVDVRMIDVRHFHPGKVGRDLLHGVRLFFRIVIDRRTPNLARVLLALGLAYWLAPIDLIPDLPIVPGFIDDVIIAILASKGFVYFCPDAVVARHAHVVS